MLKAGQRKTGLHAEHAPGGLTRNKKRAASISASGPFSVLRKYPLHRVRCCNKIVSKEVGKIRDRPQLK
ncbi:MAG: hypothetical protein D3909_00775 [Candidatus Electrothrix sp. ATG1]|nr:hypothetical protein [Candidatus Electrothrix sp. ATG1]